MTTGLPATPDSERTSVWTLDAAHSHVGFSVKHLMISTVRGRFREVEATVEIDERDPNGSAVVATIRAASVDTGNAQRDAHLRSPEFFDVERYPEITFRSDAIAVSGDRFHVSGALTMHGVTRRVVLDGRITGRAPDPSAAERLAFTATTSIERRDFGLHYNQVVETGGVLIGERVDVTLEVQLVRHGREHAAPLA